MDATEIYVLCESRSAVLAEGFLDAMLPARRPVAADYPFPEFADDPAHVFNDPQELMCRLESDKQESYSLYWNTERSDGPRQAMLFYTEDGALIAGIGDPDSSPAEAMCHIAEQVNGRFGYVTSECFPPDSIKAFKRICHNSSTTALIEGRLVNCDA